MSSIWYNVQLAIVFDRLQAVRLDTATLFPWGTKISGLYAQEVDAPCARGLLKKKKKEQAEEKFYPFSSTIKACELAGLISVLEKHV